MKKIEGHPVRAKKESNENVWGVNMMGTWNMTGDDDNDRWDDDDVSYNNDNGGDDDGWWWLLPQPPTWLPAIFLPLWTQSQQRAIVTRRWLAKRLSVVVRPSGVPPKHTKFRGQMEFWEDFLCLLKTTQNQIGIQLWELYAPCLFVCKTI